MAIFSPISIFLSFPCLSYSLIGNGVSVYLSDCLSLYLSVSLPVSVCLSLCLSVSLSHILIHSVCLFVSLSLSVSLSFCQHVSLSQSLCLFVCLTFSVCFSLSLCISLCLLVSLSLETYGPWHKSVHLWHNILWIYCKPIYTLLITLPQLLCSRIDFLCFHPLLVCVIFTGPSLLVLNLHCWFVGGTCMSWSFATLCGFCKVSCSSRSHCLWLCFLYTTKHDQWTASQHRGNRGR